MFYITYYFFVENFKIFNNTILFFVIKKRSKKCDVKKDITQYKIVITQQTKNYK